MNGHFKCLFFTDCLTYLPERNNLSYSQYLHRNAKAIHSWTW